MHKIKIPLSNAYIVIKNILKNIFTSNLCSIIMEIYCKCSLNIIRGYKHAGANKEG